MIYKAELLQLNLTYTVSICVLILKYQFENISKNKKKKNFEANLIFCRVCFEIDFFSEFEIEKKSSDTRYFENQVEIDRGLSFFPGNFHQ